MASYSYSNGTTVNAVGVEATRSLDSALPVSTLEGTRLPNARGLDALRSG